jgi:TRAP transporter 4TM/12TM fusion protein
MENKDQSLKRFFLDKNIIERCIVAVGILTSLFVIFINSGVIIFDIWFFEIIVLIGVFIIGYLPHVFKYKDGKFHFSIINCLFLLLGIVPLFYLTTQMQRLIMFYGSDIRPGDVVFGTMFIVSLLFFTKRCFGLAMPIIGLVFLLYVLLGKYLPSNYFGHRGFSYTRTIGYMFSPAGIFGDIMAVFVNTVYIYLLFGSFLEYSGATEFLINFSCSIAGKWRGGPAKIAVISSALMGTISGNAVANVATTGAVTIPLMKKTGYKPYFAGAVEAVASCGGQILPPVMGTAAFIMAELLSTSYTKVIVAATIPALLYYACVMMTVDLEAVRLGLRGMTPEEVPVLKKVMKQGGHLALPILVLVYLLLVVKMGVPRAGLFSILSIVVISALRKNTRMGLRRLCEALYDAAKSCIGIAAVIATAGLIVGTVSMTGLGMRFSSIVLVIAQDNTFLVCLLTAIICLVLGMGLPTTAAYIVAVSVAASTMLRIGIPPVAAHLFVFYFACISTITPPVCASAFTAASMAGAPMVKTGVYASMLGVTGFVIPFIFINSPLLLMQGEFLEILQAVFTALIGLAAIAMGLEGRYFFGPVKWNVFQRILFLSSALWLIIPGLKTDLVGAGIIVLVFLSSKDVWAMIRAKKGKTKPVQ